MKYIQNSQYAYWEAAHSWKTLKQIVRGGETAPGQNNPFSGQTF